MPKLASSLAPAAAMPAAATPGSMRHPLTTYLDELHRQFADLDEGEVASYIPELAKANPKWFGITLVTTDGTIYSAGDCDQTFTIQSISKAFLYALALADRGREAVLQKVGVEPTGDAFNSISLDPATGAPLNPMINAGAIATNGFIGGGSPEQQWQRIIDSLSALAGRPLEVDEAVYRSESETGFRNRAIGWMLRNFGILESDPMPVLENYFRQCSVLVNCRDLGFMGATLANGGVHPLTGRRLMERDHVEATLSVMSTCGMYDYAGSWLFDVGLPAKSGVGGGILAILPGRFAVATFSPPLDKKGNSVRGIEVCHRLSQDLGLHMMSPTRNTNITIAGAFTGATLSSKRHRPPDIENQLRSHGGAIQILRLQGDIALDGAERIVRKVMDDAAIRYAVLDMNRVNFIARPAARLLLEARRAMTAAGRALVFSRTRHQPEIELNLRKALKPGEDGLLLFADEDLAVEWCENKLLASLGLNAVHERADSLEQFEVFAGLGETERNDLMQIITTEHYRQGQLIVKAGATDDDRIYLLRSGEVSVVVDTKEGDQRRLATLSAGMVFGEMLLLGQRVRTATVHTDTDADCWVLKASAFNALSRSEPHIKIVVLENLAELLAHRLSQADALIGTLGG